MSTKAGTIGGSGRPAFLTLWIAGVSVFAATALIISALALNVARREGSGTSHAANVGVTLWDAGKLEAMQGRMLAETVRAGSAPLWDAGKLEAMRGRMLADTVRAGSAPLWDAGKLEAMQGRALAG